jgi:NADPH-dependent glutamate synthase beta subunit-like oxidoreductase/NAD-dependent dihydropyrimidine dehydrogenase PreA subunit
MKRTKDRLHRALVIGATPAGIAATNKLGEMGFPVTLVDADADWNAKLANDAWRLPCGVPLNLANRSGLMRILLNPQIRCLAPGEVISLKNTPQGFSAKVRVPATFVDPERCILCGRCIEACPAREQENGQKPVFFSGRMALPGRAIIKKAACPPCESTCPLGVNVQGYIALARAGKPEKALDVIRRENVLAGVCGRVCTHPCEKECRRAEIDEPVSIRAIKRFVADSAKDEQFAPPPAPSREQSIGIIGSGPAGLAAAADLARLGYKVTVYEAMKEAGGLLRYGIGPFRLPRAVLDRDLAFVQSLGVNIVTNSPVDWKKGIPALKKDHHALIVASGAWTDRKLRAQGEDLPGVWGCISFLSELYQGRVGDLSGKHAAVIGDGNAAFDLARAICRKGAKVTIISWFPADMLPADDEEIRAAVEEGIELACRWRVSAFEKQGKSKPLKLTLLPQKPGEPDANGIPWPVTDKDGAPSSISCDLAVIAIGQTGPFAENADTCLAVNEAGFVSAKEDFCTSIEGVWACGDGLTGPSVVVKAMACGRAAAKKVHQALSGEPVEEQKPLRPGDVPYPPINQNLPTSPRPDEPERQPAARIADFEAVCLGLTPAQAEAETARCLECGICSHCLECETACGAIGALDHADKDRTFIEQAGVVILADPLLAPHVRGEDVIRAYGPPTAKADVNAMMARGFSAAGKAMVLLSGAASRPKGHGTAFNPPDPGLAPDVRLGIFVCKCNEALGWDPRMDQFVEGLGSRPGVISTQTIDAACTPEGMAHIVRTVRTLGITRMVLASCVCCPLDFVCSACTEQRGRLKHGIFKGTGVARSMVETCNLRGEALSLLPRNRELAIARFEGLLSRSIIRARSLRALPAPLRNYNFTTAVIGQGEAAHEAASTLALAGLDVFVFGAPGKPLQKAPDHPNINAFMGSAVHHVSGTLGNFRIHAKTAEGIRAFAAGSLILGAEAGRTTPYEAQAGLPMRALQWAIQENGISGRPFLAPGATSVPGVFLADPPGIHVSHKKKGEAAAVLAASVMPRGPRQSKGYTVVVDASRCRGCGACATVCPYQAVRLAPNEINGFYAVVDEALCKGCGNCITVCPTNAADSPYRDQAYLERMLEEVLQAV